MEGDNQSVSSKKTELSREEITFFLSENYSVLFVDMVDSTRVTAEISNAYKIRKYYEVFLREISNIARMFNAKVVKNSGDSIICYFPLTSDPDNRSAFLDVLKCGTAMVAARCSLNSELNEEKLPPLSYRISADYGRVEVAISKTSKAEDLFGATMNVCSKINHLARPNGMVLGGDLFELLKRFSFSGYSFEACGSFSLGFRQPYPLYSVTAETSRKDSPESNWSKHVHDSKTSGMIVSGGALGGCASQKHSGINIMVIDDEPDTLITFKEFLEADGHNATIFVNPTEALRHYISMETTHYNLVIMDIRMPGANGLQLYQRLRALNPDIQVLFVSALDAAAELCSIFSEIPPHNVLRKPIRREQFIGAVESCLSAQLNR